MGPYLYKMKKKKFKLHTVLYKSYNTQLFEIANPNPKHMIIIISLVDHLQIERFI